MEIVKLILIVYLCGALADFIYDLPKSFKIAKEKIPNFGLGSLLIGNFITCFIFPLRIYIRYKVMLHNKGVDERMKGKSTDELMEMTDLFRELNVPEEDIKNIEKLLKEIVDESEVNNDNIKNVEKFLKEIIDEIEEEKKDD